MNLEDRFWAKVDVRGQDECWEWQGGTDKGYGVFKDRSYHTIKAHRMAYILAHDIELGSEEVVRHTCDNPPCCNPNHLILGTHADNVRDAVERGRHSYGTSRGAANGMSRLTEGDVLAIRSMAAQGYRYTEIASRFGITPENASHIARRLTWQHI